MANHVMSLMAGSTSETLTTRVPSVLPGVEGYFTQTLQPSGYFHFTRVKTLTCHFDRNFTPFYSSDTERTPGLTYLGTFELLPSA